MLLEIAANVGREPAVEIVGQQGDNAGTGRLRGHATRNYKVKTGK
jgi:hypothetical protein